MVIILGAKGTTSSVRGNFQNDGRPTGKVRDQRSGGIGGTDENVFDLSTDQRWRNIFRSEMEKY